jgi:DNA-binding MarR family transcriptional regulator
MIRAMPTGTDAAQLASGLRMVLGRLTRRLRAEGPISISMTTVLARLERAGPRTASALAAAEHVRPQSMAQIVADLAAEGFVTRRPDPGDRRQTLIELTAAGFEALERERARREGWLTEAIERNCSPAEQELLARAVEVLTRILESE